MFRVSKVSRFSLAKEAKSTTKDSIKTKTPWKARMRSAGAFMAGLIIPSVGIIIAWGLWTSMFLFNYHDDVALGWIKNKVISRPMGRLVGPGITWLIPILIAFNGGRMVYGLRGGFIAAFVITATIAGGQTLIPTFTERWSSLGPKEAPPQFIGAMLLGGASAYLVKKIEKLYLHRISSGFDMLVRNFGMGFFGLVIGAIGFWGWSPIVWGIQLGLTRFIKFFADNNITWLIALFTEPIRLVFLNNALNHGILVPMGLTEVNEMIAQGKPNPRSVFFMFDPNPGPGLGLLLSYAVWSKGQNRTNALGSTIIHFFGGIHEVFFVFVLAQPIMFLSSTTGIVLAQLWIILMGGGTIAGPSPGSIFTIIALSPGVHALWVNLVGVLIGAVSSFIVGSIILILTRKKVQSVEGIQMNFSDEGVSFDSSNDSSDKKSKVEQINKIIVACEAGMGSSSMAVGIIKKILKSGGYSEINVSHTSIKSVPENADIIVTMKTFEETIKKNHPQKIVIPVGSFIDKNAYKPLLNILKKNGQKK